MIKEYKISVIIPAYNSANYIERCINSVMNQTIPVYEIIVINDGSTDKTIEILSNIKKKHNGIDLLKVMNQVNSGPSKARNLGVKESNGNWIAFLDADDEWLPEKIESQIAVLNKNPDCAIIGTTNFFSHDKNSIIKVSFKKMLFKNYFITSSILVKKEIFLNILFDEKIKYAEDYRLWIQIIKWNEAILMHQCLVVYAENKNRYARNSLSNSLWKMEKSTLSTFQYLLSKKYINNITYVVISLYSLIKYLRRVLYKSAQRFFNF